MKIDLTPHGQPGTLIAVCGFDGSGKTTLENNLMEAISPTRRCVPAWAPGDWWREDPNACKTLYGTGDGQVLPEEALLHFNFADFHALQASVMLPALERGDVVVSNRYFFDMLALFEARGFTLPAWVRQAVTHIVEPDFCFVLDGPGQVFVDRIVARDGAMPGRFDQDVDFIERYNASLRRMAEEHDLILLRAEDEREDLLRQCLEILNGAGMAVGAGAEGSAREVGGPTA
jgi:dTMP kinase